MSTQRLEHVDQRTKCIVSGYIRNQHQIIKNSQYFLFQNMPSHIALLCTLYYHTKEHFEIVSKNVIVSNDGETISMATGLNSNYGSYIIPSTSNSVYKWTLKFSNPLRSYNRLILGIASTSIIDGLPTTLRFCDSYRVKYHYAISPYANQKKSHTMHIWTETGEGLAVENEIGLELDLKMRNISLYTYKNKKILIFDDIKVDENISYRLGVILVGKEFDVTIVKFEVD